MAGMVPVTISAPSLKSTLPKLRCFRVLMMDVPITRVRPVPTAYTGGTPNTSSPPVIRNPPPTPKKPPSIPTISPRNTSRAG